MIKELSKAGVSLYKAPAFTFCQRKNPPITFTIRAHSHASVVP